MAQQVAAQQASAVYTLVGPATYGSPTAVFNDEVSANYVMPLTGGEGITGLDSAEVRSALYERIEADGAIAGTFYHGIRPVTMSGEILSDTQTNRNIRINRLNKAINSCMASDGTLTWTPAGSISQYVKVRKYQPQRVRGGFKKDVFASFVCPDPFIYSTTLNTTTMAYNTDTVIENQGADFGPPVLLRVHGPGTNPTIRRTWNGEVLDIDLDSPSLALLSNEFIDIDPLNKTIRKATDAAPTVYTNVYQHYNFETSRWWLLGSGNNTLRLNWGGGAPTGASTLRVDWRATWL